MNGFFGPNGQVRVTYKCQVCGQESSVLGSNTPAPQCCGANMIPVAVSTVLPDELGKPDGVGVKTPAVVPSSKPQLGVMT